MFELPAELAVVFVFFIEHHFYLKERLTDKIRIIQTWVFDRHFLKKEPVSLSLQGEQLKVFVANDKICAFQQNSEFLESMYLPL